jgi:hypothetical protein
MFNDGNEKVLGRCQPDTAQVRSLLNQLFEEIATPGSTNQFTGSRCHLGDRSEHAFTAVDDGWSALLKDGSF